MPVQNARRQPDIVGDKMDRYKRLQITCNQCRQPDIVGDKYLNSVTWTNSRYSRQPDIVGDNFDISKVFRIRFFVDSPI